MSAISTSSRASPATRPEFGGRRAAHAIGASETLRRHVSERDLQVSKVGLWFPHPRTVAVGKE